VVRAVGGAWAGLTNQTEEAAELAGAGRVRIFISITLPQLKGAVVSAAALVFLFCSTSFGIVLVLGGGMVTSIETEIASAALQFLELDKAAALALLQTLLTIVAFTLAESIAKSPVGIEQIDSGDVAQGLDRRDRPAVVITGIVVIALICVPLLLVFAKAFTVNGAFGLDNFANLAGRGNRDLLNISVLQATVNTLRNVAISATLSLGFGSLVSFLLSRNTNSTAASFLQKGMDFAYLLPVGISSVVLGLGYLVTYGANWVTVPLVQALMAMPLVIRLLYPALAAIDAEQREAAALAGANTRQIFMLVETGIIRNVVVTAVGFAMIASIGEFGAASLLAYGDQATLPTVLYVLISRPGDQNFGMAMAVSAILILLTFVLVFSVAAQKPRRQPVAV
jgi:thiamine transport system permease protein